MIKRSWSDAEKLLALVEKKRLKGLREREAGSDFPLDRDELLALGQKLEEDGRVSILSFAPLFLVSKDSLDYLCRKLVAQISLYHKKHPKDKGISLEKLRIRFDAPRRVLLLALKMLLAQGKIREDGHAFALSNFEKVFSPRQETQLLKLEEMVDRGKFLSVSMDAIRRELRLSPQALQKLLDVLIERKKIVQGKDGFLVHSSWLEEIIAKIRSRGGAELSVSDFKAMTGLSRKYAIPLLELLDRMGVTRRVGAGREILQSNHL